MADDSNFHDLLQRVRVGDAAAAAELVQLYEPTIRMVVRRRLTNPALRRRFDSMDICQSVLGSFFVRAANGQFELDTPAQLQKLLAAMALHKLGHQIQKHQAARRDCRRQQDEGSGPTEVAAEEPSPSDQVAMGELLEAARRHMTEKELWVAEQRAQGKTWAELAAEVGGSADALRIAFTRAMDRIHKALGLEE